MKSVDFLYLALGAFAVIHGSYIVLLYRRYTALNRRLKELDRGK
jgi:hypothetical protein